MVRRTSVYGLHPQRSLSRSDRLGEGADFVRSATAQNLQALVRCSVASIFRSDTQRRGGWGRSEVEPPDDRAHPRTQRIIEDGEHGAFWSVHLGARQIASTPATPPQPDRATLRSRPATLPIFVRTKTRNPKHEIRNKFKTQMTQTAEISGCFAHLSFEFLIYFGFRASDFGFPIS